MKVPFNDLRAQWSELLPSIKSDMNAVIDSANFMDNKPIATFEEKLVQLHGAKNAIGVSDGTAALYLLLRGYDIGPGDEVIFPANTFIATAFAISMTGATPVPCDVELDGLISARTIKERMTAATKAVVVVHLFGCAVDLTEIKTIGDILIFEDAAQSIGNAHADMGKTTHGASISFYPGKNLGAFGQAGGILVSDDSIAHKIRCILNQGQTRKYIHKYKGGNFRLDSLQAIVLNYGIDNILSWNDKRRTIAAVYDKNLPDSIKLPMLNTVYHIYPIILPNEIDRDKLIAKLESAGIGVGIHYPIPVHRAEAYKELEKFQCPHAEYLCDRLLSLPMFTSMTEEQAKYVTDTLNESL